jgi:hypothetical protein
MSRQRYYRCPDCGGWHRQSDEVAPCSAVIKQRAIDGVERLLAQAFGHGAEDAILKYAARRINDWANRFSWGVSLREHYSARDHVLSGYIKDDLDYIESLGSAIGAGHNWQLTAEERDLVVKHWRLVDSEARKIAGENTELNYVLAAIGRAELESAVRRYDRTRNIPFGAFVKPGIHGRMINHLERVRYRQPEPRAWADDRGKRWWRGMPRGRAIEAWYPAISRLIPGKSTQDKIEARLATLNARQRAVYRGRVLTNPPLSRASLARQLGIADETQISRIEKQARRKMGRS